MALGGEGLWCGASLRPWQILHSRLARMHTCALLERDVWELMDETVQAASPPSENKKEELQMLAGDDGELWRHGGLMEARIRDWLTSKIEEETQEAPITILHPYCTSDTFSSDFSEAHDNRLDEQIAEGDVDYGDDYGYHGAKTVASCSSDQFSETWDSCTYLEEAVYEAVAGVLASGIYNEEGEEEEEEEDHGDISTNMANAAIWAAPPDTETHYCQFSKDLQASEHEEDEPLCAVCLEKLYKKELELQGYCIDDITHLPCRHSFHSSCLSPWLSASSVCPCCRAPIALSLPLNLEASPNVGMAPSGAANCSDRVQLDMMGLVAEMEAALERFGLLS